MKITRRTMLGGAAAATSFTSTALADWAPNPRYPDPSIKVLPGQAATGSLGRNDRQECCGMTRSPV
jgi:hypothetical protein